MNMMWAFISPPMLRLEGGRLLPVKRLKEKALLEYNELYCNRYIERLF